jgi:hypothetical protein
LHYRSIAAWLSQNTRADEAVMVVDPPTFYNLSHRRAVMIPTDSTDAVLAAARKYDARYLILEYDHPKPLADLYQQRVDIPWLTRVAVFSDALNRPATVYEVAQ